MKIYIFGNLLVEEDKLALELKERLQKDFSDVEFLDFDPNEEFDERNPVILDVADGVDKVCLLTDLDKIEFDKRYSLHDFDLGFNLKLMEKVGKLDSVRIICIPKSYNKELAYNEVKEIITSLC